MDYAPASSTSFWKVLAIAILWTLCPHAVAAQNDPAHGVTGTVTDATTGEALPGVNVFVTGTTIGTVTDLSGSYEIATPTPDDSLTFSYVGFVRQVVPIAGRSRIDVALEVEVLEGGEVLVVGYGGVQRKETATGAASAISGDAIAQTPAPNVSQALGGRIPGLVMVNSSGEPGADEATLRIRGQHTLNNNEPLVVIDGVPYRSGGLDRLNPDDIANITVLKDATAAIYGAQAGNGVILVTTKRGRRGAPQVSLEYNQGFVQPTRMPEMADAPTYMRMLNEINAYRGNPAVFSDDEIQRYENIDQQDPWLYQDTDWAQAAIRDVSLRSRANAAVSGGSEDVAYRVSAGLLTEEGILVNSATRFNQFNVRSNIDGRISEHVTLRFDVAGRWEDRNYPTLSSSATFENIVQSFPYLPAYWPNGQPGPAIESGENPVIMGTDATGIVADDRYYIESDVQLEVQVPGVNGLTVRANGVFDKSFVQYKSWATPWDLCSFDADLYRQQGGDPESFLSCGPQGLDDPELTQRSEDGRNVLVNLVGSYVRDTPVHDYQLLAGTEYQTFQNAFFEAFRTNFISNQIPQLFAGSIDQQNLTGSGSEGARLNFFARANYSYRDRYLLELVGRYDGSYIFPQGQRFGFFPAVSVGWRLDQERFFRERAGFFDALKLRGSWGRTGNDRVDPYQWISTFRFGPTHVFGIAQEVPTIVPAQTPNPVITWEVANQRDVGIEGELLDHRLAFSFDYFNYLRTDILSFRNASVPRTSGLVLPRENIGEVQSWGYEGSLTWRQQLGGELYYDVSLVGGYATNRIRFWDEPPGAPAWQQSTGHKMDTDLYYRAIGVFQDEAAIAAYPAWPGARPGDLMFEDVDGDGEITDLDRVRIDRNTIPDWTGGLNVGMAYKGFELSAFFQGAAGASAYVRTASGQFGNYYADFAAERWTPSNPTASGPRAFNRQDEYWMANDNTYFFEETDYIRLKNVEVAYSLAPGLAGRMGVDNVRLYLSAFNLKTWTRYDAGDPEASGDERGGTYPQKRIFNLGVNLAF